MGKNPKTETMRKYDTVPLGPAQRRELSVRKLLDKYGDPLDFLAKKMKEENDKDAAKALLPYTYPALKSVELSGPGGGAVNVEIVKITPG